MDKIKANSVTVYLYDTVAEHVVAVQSYPNTGTALRSLQTLADNKEYQKGMELKDIKVFASEVYYSTNNISVMQAVTLINSMADLQKEPNG